MKGQFTEGEARLTNTEDAESHIIREIQTMRCHLTPKLQAKITVS